MEKGFWSQLKKPFIGLAPMDGITDAPFRAMAAKYGEPDLLITEFTSVEGISHGAIKTMSAFLFNETERPVCAQVFGTDPAGFYQSAILIAEMGFDGIDINMGCPAHNVSSRGAGAGLIQTPKLAQEIIRAAQQGAKDWSEGKTIEESGLPKKIIAFAKKNAVKRSPSTAPNQATQRPLLPVSVKTRIGFNEIVITEWVKYLLETQPVNISIHGRTLKQMYTGSANWEAIAQAAEIIHQTETTVVGNGDVLSKADGLNKIQQYGVDGVMIGRAAFGNPWIFKNKLPADISLEERVQVAMEHSHLYEKIFEGQHFFAMRKHLAWYCKGFPGASEVRKQLMQTNSAQEVSTVLMALLKTQRYNTQETNHL